MDMLVAIYKEVIQLTSEKIKAITGSAATKKHLKHGATYQEKRS